MYPINYDFGANWKSKIVPHLDNPKIKKALRTGINDYLLNFPGNDKYKKNTCPAKYSSNDGYCMLMDRKGEMYIEELAKNNKLPKKYLNLKNNKDYCMELFFMEEDIKKPLYQWKNIKYDLESYFLSGSCYSYAPTFELTLAKLVEPNEKWMVRVGENHATVINKEETKIFDLLYWAALGGRLNNYMFGDELEEIDETLGGKEAYFIFFH